MWIQFSIYLLWLRNPPQLTSINGLDAKHQWYLFQQIRPFCKSVLSADFTCPKPSCPKSTDQTPVSISCTVSTVSQTAKSTAVSRGKRKCSQCNKVGHTKRTCKGLNKS